MAIAVIFIPARLTAQDGGSWTDKIGFSGYFQSDIRHQIEDYRGVSPDEGYKFEMNQNLINLRLEIYPEDNIRAVIDTKLKFYGFNESATVPETVNRRKLDPYHFQLDEAYLEIREIGWEGMDLKIGRMVQNWGAADQFNPTDNLNARDMSDPLDPSAKVPNQMIEIDFYPTEWLTLTFVWVPVFKPSQLPPSANLAFAVEYDRNGCFRRAPTPPLSEGDIRELEKAFEVIDECKINFIPKVRTINPPFNIRNSQVAAKARLVVWDFDFSFSYYYGRHSLPVAYSALAGINDGSGKWAYLDPKTLSEIQPHIDNTKDGNVAYVAEVMYPRMQVAGFDFSYSADWAGGLGIVGEMVLIFPEEVKFGLRTFMNDDLLPRGEMSKVNVPSDPFIKATLGVDYSLTKWLYVNLMYVRGFIDEFNDAYGIHNYLAGIIQFKFLDDELKVDLSWAWRVCDFSGDYHAGFIPGFVCNDLSAAVYPRISYLVYPSVELSAGAIIYIGDTEPYDEYSYAGKYKFGQKAVGRNVAFFRAKVNW